jgi:uncharacterized membrane protein YgaE (UPF0421/DUF939 family)
VELINLRRFKFVGSRIFKTGVAVFLTAIVCQSLNWPPVFAVITAIVTVEPTVSDSIKKGIIRFPASAIGSAYAVLFISLFGNSAITYTLAAVFTITTCFKLNLHTGLLVATLTSVAMVEVIHSNFLISFFIRLGTTTVGLGVSTLVNMFILPPDYRDDISKQIQNIATNTSIAIEAIFKHLLYDEDITEKDKEIMRKLTQELSKTEKLSQFQKDEETFHPLVKREKKIFQKADSQLNTMRSIHYHVNNLILTPIGQLNWSNSERAMIIEKVKRLVFVLRQPEQYDKKTYHKQHSELVKLFWLDNQEIIMKHEHQLTKFPTEIVILYELLSIVELIDDYLINKKE